MWIIWKTARGTTLGLMMFWGCFEEVMILRSWEDATFVCSVGECFNKHQQKYNIKMMVEDVRELICEMALCRSALQTMSQRAHLQKIFFSSASPKHHFHYHMRMFLRMFWGGDDFKIIKRCYTFCLFCRGKLCSICQDKQTANIYL